MIKFSYKVKGNTVDVNFNSYADLLLFVASSDIKDEDFVSMDLGDGVINGIEGLKETAINVATKMKESEIEDCYDCDECEDDEDSMYEDEEYEFDDEDDEDLEEDDGGTKPMRIYHINEETGEVFGYDRHYDRYTVDIDPDNDYEIVYDGVHTSLEDVLDEDGYRNVKIINIKGSRIKEHDIVFLYEDEMEYSEEN